MKKTVIALVVIAIIVAIVAVAVLFLGGKEEEKDTGKQIQNAQEMQKMLEDINTKLGEALPALEIREVDVNDELAVTGVTGLTTATNIEAIVVSEPFMSSQAFSAVMVKVSENANVEEMKQEMLNQIDIRKWICVSAEKVYVTNYKNIIFLVMSSEEWAKPVYDEFKQAVGGKVGKELERTEQI